MYNRLRDRKYLITRRTFLIGCAGVLCPGAITGCQDSGKLAEPTYIKVAQLEDLTQGYNNFPLQLVALYRDGANVKALSLMCTHQQCPVKPDAQGFLCPCHGSRFDQDGRVLNGPAEVDLRWLPVKISEAGEVSVQFAPVLG
jgi:Rieske Fe-S protein